MRRFACPLIPVQAKRFLMENHRRMISAAIRRALRRVREYAHN
jgi:hypothetical protein